MVKVDIVDSHVAQEREVLFCFGQGGSGLWLYTDCYRAKIVFRRVANAVSSSARGRLVVYCSRKPLKVTGNGGVWRRGRTGRVGYIKSWLELA